MIQAPILHVNGDDPEAVVWCAQMAAEFRQTFGCDIVIDMVCYRRHGHNETDEPAFTQPIMYRAIRAQKTTRTLYAETLAREGVVAPEAAQALVDNFAQTLEDAAQAARSYRPNKADWLEGHWAGLTTYWDEKATPTEDHTAVTPETLQTIGAALTRVPEGFDVNPKIARQLEAKREMLERGEGIDWATGEALGFGSLLLEGHRVRLSGEDSQRGTFSQRHAVLIDQTNQHEYVPLNNIAPGQAKIEIYNSLLSEAGVLGFEYGYSLADPRTLVLWEAQFGDFANGAQVIIDQFMASGETKWLRMSGLVLLLPHGYEGQGPEHSSARLERYLQLCAEHNMQVANITTPAKYFHALRRQMQAQLPQAAGADDAEEPAAPQARDLHRSPSSPASPVPHRAPRDRPDRAGGGGAARRAVQRQGLLRPAGGAARTGHRRRRHRAPRAALSVPRPLAAAGARHLSAREDRVVPGGAAEHGRVALRRPPHREACWNTSTSRRGGPSMSGARRRRAPPRGWPRSTRPSRRRWCARPSTHD